LDVHATILFLCHRQQRPALVMAVRYSTARSLSASAMLQAGVIPALCERQCAQACLADELTNPLGFLAKYEAFAP
jgi:hypothetical protein